MRDYQKELAQLRERITQLREDTRILERLRQQERQAVQEEADRCTRWNQEQQDVEKLEKLTLSSIFAALRGSKEDDLEREQAEAYAARLKWQEAQRQLEEIRYDIRIRQERIKYNQGCEKQYEALMREKIRDSDPVRGEKLAELDRREMGLAARKKELLEALGAGSQTQADIRKVMEALDSAGGWSTFDLLGGGMLADAMKYSKMDEAQKQMERVQSDLRRYQAELADVAKTAAFDLQPGGFLQFADFFWDNLFTDWAVRDHISRSRDQMRGLQDQVARIQTGLQQELDETERGMKAVQNEKKQLLRED